MWVQVPRETMGRGRKALHTRWIFKIKTTTTETNSSKPGWLLRGTSKCPESTSPKPFRLWPETPRFAPCWPLQCTLDGIARRSTSRLLSSTPTWKKMCSSKSPKVSKQEGSSIETTSANCSRQSTESFKPLAVGRRPSQRR